MSNDRRQEGRRASRVTPVVARVMVAYALVFLVLQTVLTSPTFLNVLQFAAPRAIDRPWTFVSYMFVHTGIFHLGVNMLALFVFGPALERRMGGRGFLVYYLYCGVGAAFFCLGLAALFPAPVPPFIGASGAMLGLALAYAMVWPDEEMSLFPLPLRLSARAVASLLAVAALLLPLTAEGGAAHLANLGGLASGYLFFRIRALRDSRVRREPKALARRAVLTPITVRQGSPAVQVRPALAAPEPHPESAPDALDRVLDKISASGLESLTPEERRFLDEIAERKRKSSS
jgi:membrane associated rhomboid family serine protease